MNKHCDYTNPQQLKKRQPSGWVPAADFPLDVTWAAELSLPLQLRHTCCGMCGAGTPEDRLCHSHVCSAGSEGGQSSSPGMCTVHPSSSAREGCFDVQSLFLGIRCHMQEGTALFLSPACQTTTQKLTINLKA